MYVDYLLQCILPLTMIASAATRASAAPLACRMPQLGARSRHQAAHISPLRAPQRPQRTRASAAAPAKEGAKAPSASIGFKNCQKFFVPKEAEAPFQRAWKERAAHMENMEGFVSFNITQAGENYTVVSAWESIPAWEAFSLSAEARRQHLPSGIWQFVPKKGEGFPEDFVPFYELSEQVQAKYNKKG